MQTQSFLDPRTESVLTELAKKRLERSGRNPTASAIVAMARAIKESIAAEVSSGRPSVGIVETVRGLMATRGTPIDHATADADAQFAKALVTGTTPGSYLVPADTSKDIVEFLAQIEAVRVAGCRVWPMPSLQHLDIAVGITSPSFAWTAQNSRMSASDPSLGQISFDLKTLATLIQSSAQLFKTASPQMNSLMNLCLAEGLADAADAALFSTSTVSGAPTSLMAASGLTVINAANGSANGGSLLYSDLTAVLQKAADLKIHGPFAWFCNGKTLLRVLSLSDSTSRPLFHLGPAVFPASGFLLGHPVYVTANISSTEAVGSGTNQSHLIFAPPRFIHFGEDTDVSISVSDEWAFDSAAIGIRIERRCDWAFQPAAGIIVLQGIN